MRILQVYKADLLNGVGLRNVYFFSGCTHNCKGCFNAETANPNAVSSRQWTDIDFEQMVRDTSHDHISGITLTGGDPLSIWNEHDILDLCRRFKQVLPNKSIWCYTGYVWEDIQGSIKGEILKYIDVLCDGPFIDSRKSPSKPWVGSENQRVIDVQKSLESGKVVLYT